MQQLQSLYRGDSSPSLAQIFGMQYQPQAATSQMANTALASGMSAGAQVKTTAMNNATQMAIADANRFEQRRQFGLTDRLANRQQSEIERNNLATNAYNQGMLANTTRTTDFNTGGNVDLADNDAMMQGQTMLTMIDTQIQALDKTDPNYNAQVAALQQRRQAIANQLAAGKKAGRGGASGVMKVITPEVMRPFGRDGKPAQGGIADYVSTIVQRTNSQAKAPSPPVANTNALTPYDQSVLNEVRGISGRTDSSAPFDYGDVSRNPSVFEPINPDDYRITSGLPEPITAQPAPAAPDTSAQPGIQAQGLKASETPTYREFKVPGLRKM